MADQLETEMGRLKAAVGEQFRANSAWDSMKLGLHHTLSRSGVTRCEAEFPAGWTEAEDELRGGVALDIVYVTRNRTVVAVEVETSYMSASHDLLKLAYFAGGDEVQSVGLGSYLGVIVTHEDALKSGPQKTVYSRLVRRVEAIRKSPLLGQVFGRLNLGVIGVTPEAATVHKLYYASQPRRT